MPAWIWQKQIDEFSKNYHVIAVDPRSQGESDKPTYGHLPETRARDYKELVDHLGLKQPVLVGWSMACGELVKYAEQFGTDNVGGFVLVDGFLSDQASPEMFAAIVRMDEPTCNWIVGNKPTVLFEACTKSRRSERLPESRHRRLRPGSSRYCGRAHLQHDCSKGFLSRLSQDESPGALRLPARIAAERRLPEIKARRQAFAWSDSTATVTPCSSTTRRNSTTCSKNSCKASKYQAARCVETLSPHFAASGCVTIIAGTSCCLTRLL